MTLRVRVALLVAAVVAVVVAAVGWTAVRSARAELTEEVDQDLLERAALVFAEPRGDFWAGSLAHRSTGIGSLLRADPLGSLVSLDAYARVVVTDLDAGADGVIRGQVIVALDDDIGTVPDVDRLERARRRGPVMETIIVEGLSLRLMTVRAADGVFVQVARPLDEVENAVEDLRRQVLLFGLLAVVVAAAGAWFLAGRAVRPIVRLTETAEHIAETGDVDRPVEGSEAGEVGRLARSFRTMLAALSASRRQQHQLVMDASHELRTPLTSLRTNV
ncbi:MAG: HAMP domain-containing protein, partial [Acidimicrobiaceae bacterium]|nr:HAMP domain-containing protein [Acidimicrobiaceae bacterium]